MTALCLRCGRRERAPGLLVCEACLNGLVSRTPEPAKPVFIPEWRRRLTARDETGRMAA